MDLSAKMPDTGGMMRPLPIAFLAACFSFWRRRRMRAAPRSRVEAGVKEAGLALAGPKPFVDIVCPIMQEQAEARGLRRCRSCA